MQKQSHSLTHALEVIVILDLFNVQSACNHVNDGFFAHTGYSQIYSIKRNEYKIQNMMHAKVNLENSIPSVKCISMFCCAHQYETNGKEQHSAIQHTNRFFSMDAKKLMKNGWQCMTNSVERWKKEQNRGKKKNRTA